MQVYLAGGCQGWLCTCDAQCLLCEAKSSLTCSHMLQHKLSGTWRQGPKKEASTLQCPIVMALRTRWMADSRVCSTDEQKKHWFVMTTLAADLIVG